MKKRLNDLEVGDIIIVDGDRGFCHRSKEEVTNIKKAYDEKTGESYLIICCGDKNQFEYDSRTGHAITPPFAYYIVNCIDSVVPKYEEIQKKVSKHLEQENAKKQKNLDLKTLRKANVERIGYFTDKDGVSRCNDWTPAQWLQAMTGEVGEYANIRKKFERGDFSEEVFKEEAAKELADIAIYLDLLAYQVGIDLSEAIINKFNEVSDRVNCDIKL